MFEDLVSSLLSRYLGDYLEGLSRKDLKLSLWKGDVELKNLRVKTEALDFLNLPIQVKEGFVGSLSLKIPWKHLGSENTKIHLDDVYVIACPKSELKYNEEEEKAKEQQRKMEQLQAIEENDIRMDAELNAKEDNSAVAKLVAKIIDNIQISVNRVHIRFEDHSSIPGHPFAAGIILEKLHLHTPSDNGNEPEMIIPGVMRKKVRVTRFGVYWDFDNPSCIRTKSIETMQEEMKYPFIPLTEVPMGKEGLVPHHWIIDPISLFLQVKADTRKTELRKPSYQEAIDVVVKELNWSDKIDETKRIIHAYKHVRKDDVRGRTAEEEWCLMKEYLQKKYPSLYSDDLLETAHSFCLRCWDVSNTPASILEVSGEMNKIFIQIDQKQYRDMLGFMSALNTQTLKAKYKRFKTMRGTPEANPRGWWKFAIQSVMWENEKRRNNRGWKQVMQFKQQRAEYITLYKRKNGMKPSLKKDPKGLSELQKLEEKLSMENIVLFRKIAMQELENEEKLKAKKKEKEKKEKREKNVFLKMFSKKKKKKEDESDSEEEEEINLDDVWNEEKRQELYTEFDIHPEDISPWEGGRPTDIQMSLEFKLNQVGIRLINHGNTIMDCSCIDLRTQVMKRKSYLQVFACLKDIRIEDGSQYCEKWPAIVYAEKEAVSNQQAMTLFVPSQLVEENETPFLQASIEIPSMTKDQDISVKATTLPLCCVGNMAFIMDLAAFFVPELSKLNFAALSASTTSLYSQLSSTKKLKLKASQEVRSHKNIGLDVIIGALHVILPEDIKKDVTETQCLVARFGDIIVKSDPKHMNIDEKLTEETIYDKIDVQIHRMNMIFTNYEEHWASYEVQQQKNLHLVNDFNCNAEIGLSIAPSQTDFANTFVNAKADRIEMCLTKQKYLAITRFASSFSQNLSSLIADSDVDFSSLTNQAKEAISNTLAEKNEEEKKNESTQVISQDDNMNDDEKKKDYSDEEIRLLQQNRLLSLKLAFDGISVLIEEVSTANEHTKIAQAVIAGLSIGVEQRTFDMNVNVALNCIEVQDCLQSASTGRPEYLIASKPINSTGMIEPARVQDLFQITVSIVQPDSPDYWNVESDVQVNVLFGSFSVLVYRPTLYHLLKFIAPETEEEKQIIQPQQVKRRRSSSTSSVSSYLSALIEKESVSIQSRAADLIKSKSHSIARVEQAKPIPSNWTRQQVNVNICIESLSVFLRANSGKGLLFGTVEGLHVGVAICPATVAIQCDLSMISLRDVSPGAGYYPDILKIVTKEENERFVDCKIILYTDPRYPRYPGYMMSVEGNISSPSLTIRMRIIDELTRYFLAGPIAEGLEFFKKTETPAVNETPEVGEVPHFAMDTIEEEDEDEENEENNTTSSIGQSVLDSVLLLGKSYFIPSQEKHEKLPFILPLIHFTLNTIQVSIPVASASKEVAIFELGSLSIENTKPMSHMEKDRLHVDMNSMKETLNTIHLSIKNMKATTTITTSTGIKNLAVLGGINLQIAAVVANVIEANVRITKMALAMNEEQLAMIMKVMKGNIAEKAVMIEDIVVTKEKEEKEEEKKQVKPKAKADSRKSQRFSDRLSRTINLVQEEEEDKKEEEEVFGKHIRGQFCFDGICIELLNGCEGYDGIFSGQEIYKEIGTLKNSISCFDVGTVDCFVQLHNTDVSAGITLSHMVIRDTRTTTSIHSNYRTPFSFGAEGKPAISILASVATRPVSNFTEISEIITTEQKNVQDIKVSVRIGKLCIIPTPWIFDILKIVEGLMKTVIEEKTEVEVEEVVDTTNSSMSPSTTTTVTKSIENQTSEEKETILTPQIDAIFCIEDPSIYFIEDPTKDFSPSFLLSLSISAHASISPLMNVDASVGIRNIRGFRSHPLDTVIPAPGLTDAITPFDINLNLHTASVMKKIQGTLMTNHDVDIRVGLLDAKLFTNFFYNLIPQAVKEEMKERKEKEEEKKKEEKKNENMKEKKEESKKKTDLELSVKVLMNSTTITVVNDIRDLELPVMQIILGDLNASLEQNPDLMTIEASLSLLADYYNESLTVWEPVIEKWELHCLMEQESRERVIQRLTALQSAGNENENALLRISINTTTMLNCNITAAFIKAALQSVNAFQDCKESTQKISDACFIGLRNSSGLPIEYSIGHDNGLNEIIERQESYRLESKLKENGFFSGLANILMNQTVQTCWVTLSYQQPTICVYSMIPSVESELKPLLIGDSFTLLDKNESIFSEVCVIRSSSTSDLCVLSVENDDEKEVWRKALQSIALGPPQVQQRLSMMIEQVSSLSSDTSIQTTSLPAHPSLTLKYYKQPYRKIAPRSILLSLNGYPSFSYLVDRSDNKCVTLTAPGLPSHKLFLHSVVEKGKKVICISSEYHVENRLAQPIIAAFGKWVQESDLSYAEFNSSCLNEKETLWSSCVEVNSGLFLGLHEVTCCLSIEDICSQEYYGLVNIGDDENPFFVNITCEKEYVYRSDDNTQKEETYHIIISNVAVLENLLPVGIDYRVLNKFDKVIDEGSIKEGGEISFNSCRFTKDENYHISLRLSNDTYAYSPYNESIDLFVSNGTVHLNDRNHFRNLNLAYTICRESTGLITIQLYCDYWIMNKTGDTILIRDSKDKDYVYECSSTPLEVRNYSETICSKEELLLPMLFSVKKKEKNDCARISLPGYNSYSDAFSINTLGVTGTVTVSSKDHKQPEKVYGVSITRGPGIFARSCVITLTPLYILVNQTTVPVSIRQQDCESITNIPSKQSSSFHWFNQTSNHSIQLHLDTLDYEWSQPFELVPSHISLQMLKARSLSSQYDCWEHEEIEDPIDCPYSVVQVDITMVSSQCYIFIKKMDPSYMPFCISNNTALDCITIAQENASWNYALTVQPLTSRLWTLPKVTTNPTIAVYCKKLGGLSDKTDYALKLVLDVTKPGKLGEFMMKDPKRTIRVSMEMQRSMKVLIFEEVKNKTFSLMKQETTQDRVRYLAERRKDLMELSSSLSSQIDTEVNSILDYIKQQEQQGSALPPSARSTYLQFRYAYDTNIYCKKTMRVRIFFKIRNNVYETGSIRGALNYFGTYKIDNEVDEIELTMEAKNDLQMTTKGNAILKLCDFCEQDRLYDLNIPFYQEDGKSMLGFVNVRFVNCRDEHIAEASFKREEFYYQNALVENVIQRIHTEAYLEKRLSKNPSMKNSISQHVSRATQSGVYKSYSSPSSASSVSPSSSSLSHHSSYSSKSSNSTSRMMSSLSINQLNVFNEEENTEEIERTMNYCLTVNQLMKIPLPPAELKNIYVTATIGQTTLRSPSSSQVAADPESYPVTDDEFIYEATINNLGFTFHKEGNTMLVNEVIKDGPADKAGVRVGHIIAAVNGGDVPPTVDELKLLIDSSETVWFNLVAPPIKDYSAILFTQRFIFPAGTTVGETSMHIAVYRETDADKDDVLVAADIPINRNNDGTYDIRLNRVFSACLNSQWSSFNPEEEIASLSFKLDFKGFGISLINAKPSELLYFSLNDLRGNVSLFESGKKTMEVRLKSLQVDNQIVGCRFPVLFGSPLSSDRDWLHTSAIILPHPSVLYIEYFSILIQEMKVNCDSRILVNLLEFISSIPFDLLEFSNQEPLKQLNDYPEFIKPLLLPDTAINSTSLFAEDLELQPMLITLTNKMDAAYPLTSSILPAIPFLIPIQALIDTAGTFIGNIDNAQIKLNSYTADTLFMTQQDLISRLKLHYTKQFVSQLYKIIGSFNFLGNPVGLAENLTSGVKAFFYEPMQGIVKSPKDFVAGIGRGTKTLLMNTAYGVLNTVSKITSTIADGLASLTMSEEYKNDRAAGKGGILFGVKEGITGVFKDTKKGKEKGGFVGAIAGTGKGLLNLVVKPVVGVVDQTTKLFDNAKDITQVEKRMNRCREPRYIYKDHCLTSFNDYLAKGQAMMCECKANTIIPTEEEYFIHMMVDSQKTALIVGNSRFIWYDYSSNKINQVIKYKHLLQIEQKQRALLLHCDNKQVISVILDEEIALILPALQNRILRNETSAITNLIVRILMVLNEPVSEDDQLLAELETVSVDGPSLLESVDSMKVTEEVKVKPRCQSFSKETIDSCMINQAEVLTYHQGVEASKSILKSGNSYVEYEIIVTASEQHCRWVVYRRYTQFKDVYDLLKRDYPEKAKSLRLPGKQLKLIQNKSMLEKRVNELNEFVKVIASDMEMNKEEYVIAFLKDNFVRTESC